MHSAYLLFLLLMHTVLPLKAGTIPIELEIAFTEEERAWGLMQRSHLPENRGMLFYFPKGNLWMFNTLIDLSAAFLDDKGSILEIAELKSYPEMMDPHRPVNKLSEMWKYPADDKIYLFFLQKSKALPRGTYYILEMNKEWFKKKGVTVGDKVVWHLNSSQASIVKLSSPSKGK